MHLLRRPDDARAIATARDQQAEHAVSLVLLPPHASTAVDFEGPVYVLGDRQGRDSGEPGMAKIGYDELVALVCAHERVIAW